MRADRRGRIRRALAPAGTIILALWSASVFAQSPGQPAGKDTAEPMGVVKGRITAADTGLPLQGAGVQLLGQDRQGASTDASGQFEFSRVTPGRYKVRAVKAGFVSTDYGEDAAAGVEAREIEMAGGRVAEHIDIALARGAAIEGRVVNQHGEPVPGWAVKAMLRVEDLALPYPVQPSLPRRTDDRGRFRLFGLVPGDYVVAVEPPAGLPGTRTYVPGVMDPDMARELAVGPSAEITGIDLVVHEPDLPASPPPQRRLGPLTSPPR